MTSQEIEKQTKTFLSKGGKIKELKPTDRAEVVRLSAKAMSMVNNSVNFLNDVGAILP